MSNYFPADLNRHGPNPWVGRIPNPESRPSTRPGRVNSGSQRNYNRGYTGAPEMARMGSVVDAATTGFARLYFTRGALRDLEKHVDEKGGASKGKVKTKATSSTPELGEPNTKGTTPTPSGKKPSPPQPLALAMGPRPMGPPQSSTRDQDNAPRALEGSRPLLALGAGPRVTPLGPAPGPARPMEQSQTGPEYPSVEGFSSRLEQGDAPDARLAGRGPAPKDDRKPQWRESGRRTTTGMDPRKRGTWMNYQ